MNLARAWHPLLAKRRPGDDAALDWSDFPTYKPQEPEEMGLTGISFPEFGASLLRAREIDPKHVEQFLIELRQQFNEVRGTPMEREFAKALPRLEANLPTDLWRRHFADIDPTPANSYGIKLSIALGVLAALIAGAAFWLFRRKNAAQ